MSEKIVQLNENEEVIKGLLQELVRGNVGETLNKLLKAEAEIGSLVGTKGTAPRVRSGHYSRKLTSSPGDITLSVPKLKGISFNIERYRRRESIVEETLIEM